MQLKCSKNFYCNLNGDVISLSFTWKWKSCKKKKKCIARLQKHDFLEEKLFLFFSPTRRTFFHLIENFYDVNITCNNSQGAILEAISNSTPVLRVIIIRSHFMSHSHRSWLADAFISTNSTPLGRFGNTKEH